MIGFTKMSITQVIIEPCTDLIDRMQEIEIEILNKDSLNKNTDIVEFSIL